jgi:hypothetical protein
MYYDICLSGEIEPMSQLQVTIDLVVNPASGGGKPLAFIPNGNLQPETEGVNDPGQALGTVTGGTPPYTFTATGIPNGDSLSQVPSVDGVAGDVDVEISGMPAVGDAANSPYNIELTINDSAGSAVTANVRKPTPTPVRVPISVKR